MLPGCPPLSSTSTIRNHWTLKLDKFDIEAVSFLGEDSVLHIPEALTWAGTAYEVELEQTSSGVFELSEATLTQEN